MAACCEGSTADLLLHKTAECLFVEAFDHSIMVGRSISPTHISSTPEKNSKGFLANDDLGKKQTYLIYFVLFFPVLTYE